MPFPLPRWPRAAYPRRVKRFIISTLASFFYTGYFPFAPATFASLVWLAIYLFVPGGWWLVHPIVVVCTTAIAIYLSNGPRLIERTQSWGRIDRPGATSPMTLVDVIATGPKGQKTIDHSILKALRGKQDMANWSVNEWRRILAET